METLKSEGRCIFCNETLPKAAIGRHLKTHFNEKSRAEKPGTSYVLKVELNQKYGAAGYFLYLWVGNQASMEDIDFFLREIWLECCGHMSSFIDTSTKKQRGKGFGGYFDDFDLANEYLERGNMKKYEKLMEETTGEIPKSRKVEKVFYKGQKLEYSYDFGSTTDLLITVVEELKINADQDIILLSRNEPLELLCDMCKKESAVQVCTIHGWEEDSLFCPKCAKKHVKQCENFDDYAAMPVVNSPRMGVCGYTGGTIDIERDGVFKKI